MESYYGTAENQIETLKYFSKKESFLFFSKVLLFGNIYCWTLGMILGWFCTEGENYYLSFGYAMVVLISTLVLVGIQSKKWLKRYVVGSVSMFTYILPFLVSSLFPLIIGIAETILLLTNHQEIVEMISTSEYFVATVLSPVPGATQIVSGLPLFWEMTPVKFICYTIIKIIICILPAIVICLTNKNNLYDKNIKD